MAWNPFGRRTRRDPAPAESTGGESEEGVPAVARAAMADLLLDRAREREGIADFVQLGAGSGLLALQLAELRPDTRVLGIDESTDRVRVATEAAAAAGLADRVAFQRAEIGTWPLADATVPLLLGHDLLAELPTLKAFAVEVLRVLAPGGQLLLAEWLPSAVSGAVDDPREALLRERLLRWENDPWLGPRARLECFRPRRDRPELLEVRLSPLGGA